LLPTVADVPSEQLIVAVPLPSSATVQLPPSALSPLAPGSPFGPAQPRTKIRDEIKPSDADQ
jgi:hypothetical protein